MKLKQVKADWAVQNLSFSNFKTRGELLLRGEEASESISLMEDSLMVLSSLMSNRSAINNSISAGWGGLGIIGLSYTFESAAKLGGRVSLPVTPPLLH